MVVLLTDTQELLEQEKIQNNQLSSTTATTTCLYTQVSP